ncbi:MAG: hypothetical protein HY904_18110 [Deltaproteobacteria bacterium]|nr:hypothetical protein [Deltaproteobacteria bacterium]
MSTEGAERYRDDDARAPCRPGPATMECLCESAEPACVRGTCEAVATHLRDGGS